MDDSKELSIKKKCQKDYPEFTDQVDTLSVQELEKNIIRYANYREETELEKQKDPDLQRAKETVKELSAPYNDTLKALKLKMAYLYLLVGERGAEEENGQEEAQQ